MATTTRYVTIDPSKDDGSGDIEVLFYGDCHWENDGIGSYEYWGYKGYDKGIDYVQCDNVEWDEKLYTPEVNAIIKQYLSDNNDDIWREIEDDYEKKCSED